MGTQLKLGALMIKHFVEKAATNDEH